MTFETFQPRTTEHGVPVVSVYKTGSMYFSVAAVKAFSIRKGTQVILKFDRDASIMGIQILKDDVPPYKARSLSRSGGGGLLIPIKTFLNFYHIDFSENRTYPIMWDREKKMLLVRLYTSTP